MSNTISYFLLLSLVLLVGCTCTSYNIINKTNIINVFNVTNITTEVNITSYINITNIINVTNIVNITETYPNHSICIGYPNSTYKNLTTYNYDCTYPNGGYINTTNTLHLWTTSQ